MRVECQFEIQSIIFWTKLPSTNLQSRGLCCSYFGDPVSSAMVRLVLTFAKGDIATLSNLTRGTTEYKWTVDNVHNWRRNEPAHFTVANNSTERLENFAWHEPRQDRKETVWQLEERRQVHTERSRGHDRISSTHHALVTPRNPPESSCIPLVENKSQSNSEQAQPKPKTGTLPEPIGLQESSGPIGLATDSQHDAALPQVVRRKDSQDEYLVRCPTCTSVSQISTLGCPTYELKLLLKKYGRSDGCPRCGEFGPSHSTDCRLRLEKAMVDSGEAFCARWSAREDD